MGLANLFRRKNVEDSVSVSVGKTLGWSDLMSFGKDKALENSAFWICLINLARTFGSLPIHTYSRTKDGSRQVDTTSDEAQLIRNPCPYMNPYAFRFSMAVNFELYGVAYAKIARSHNGSPIGLFPIASTLIVPVVKNGALAYQYSPTGEVIPRSEMLVILNITANGLLPLSPLDYMKADLAVADSAKAMQTNWFSRGTMLGGIVKVPGNTPKATKDEIREQFQSGFGGSANSFKTAVIPDSSSYDPVKIDSKTAEFQEAQRWTVAEVARRFGVPEAFAGGSIKETYANAEQRGIDLVQYAILPRSVAWQEAFNEVLFPRDSSRYVKINLNGLMRGDAAARSAFYHNGLMDGWLSANDVRSLEDMDPIEYGDMYMVPMNYVPRGIAATTNPYTYQTFNPDTGQYESIEDSGGLLEDKAFMNERVAVAASQRKAIERLARRQLAREIQTLKDLIEEGATVPEILEKFRLATEKIAKEFGNDYVKAFTKIAEKIKPIVQRQVRTGSVDQSAFDRFVKAYAIGAADRHGRDRVTALEKDLNGATDDEAAEVIDRSTQHWVATVPVRESDTETNRSANAMTVFLYSALGVTMMRVVASPDACDFCKKIDGRVVEVNGYILKAGEDVDDGAGNILHITKSKKHPPFHGGCVCSVAPGR